MKYYVKIVKSPVSSIFCNHRYKIIHLFSRGLNIKFRVLEALIIRKGTLYDGEKISYDVKKQVGR